VGGNSAGFNQHILARGLKPLILGEAIAADTWIDRDALLKHFGDQRPWYASAVLDASAAWESRMRSWAGPGGLEQLYSDSLRYGLLMRKFQAEVYRREIPYGGYVVSVIRDIPKASMGLLDYLGRSKWTTDEWGWQRDTICLLKTEGDRRCFATGERIRGDLLLSHFGTTAIDKGHLTLTLARPNASPPGVELLELKELQQNPGTLAQVVEIDWATQTCPRPHNC